MKWMKDPLAGFISRCGARMGKFTALLVTIAMLAGTTGAGATAFADETVTDGGNVAAESAASQPESTQQSDAENAVGSDVADIAGQDVAGQSATDDDDAQCLTDDGESQQPSNEQAQSQLQSQSQPEQPSETMPEQRQPCDKTEQPNEQKEQERQVVRRPTAENADVPANGAAPAQDGDRNDHAGENRTDAVANGDAGATADDGKTGDADDADNDGNTAEDADDADKNGKNDADEDNADKASASAQNGNDNDKNDAAKDDADADEHIMRDRFAFNRKTVMRAARNVAVPQPDWRSCCASANPIRRWRSERASRQATGLVRAGESLNDQRFTRFCCDEYGRFRVSYRLKWLEKRHSYRYDGTQSEQRIGLRPCIANAYRKRASQTESQAEQGNGMTEAIRLPCGGREPPHAKPKGNIMCNGGGAFSPEEVEYLRSLPVVAEATSRRITYTESFKHNCMRRYHAGESPVELFREAGLDPSLIGYKRIERCFARWRKIACRMGTDRLVSVDGNGGVVPSASADVAPSAESAEVARSAVSQPVQPTQTTETQSNATLPAPRNAAEVPILSGGDVRDLLIAQQVRRIDELEREVAALRAELHRK